MVYYGTDRLWYGYEWERYLTYGRVHCARLGWRTWINQEHQNFNTSMAIFDDESQWFRRPENMRPLCEKD